MVLKVVRSKVSPNQAVSRFGWLITLCWLMERFLMRCASHRRMIADVRFRAVFGVAGKIRWKIYSGAVFA
jgi:hypothetical protein